MKIALTALACVFGLLAATQTAFADPPKRNSVCIDPGDIDHMSYPDDSTILFYMRGGHTKIWRNDLPRACHGLKFEGGIAWEIRGGMICSNMQTFYVLRRWIPCSLGNFTPYTPPPKAPDAGGH